MLYNVPLYKVEEGRRGRPGRRMQCGGPAPSWVNRGCLQRPDCLLLRLSAPPQMPNNQPQGTRETFQYHLSELHSRAPKCQALVTTDIHRAPGLRDQPSGGCTQDWTGERPFLPTAASWGTGPAFPGALLKELARLPLKEAGTFAKQRGCWETGGTDVLVSHVHR